MSGKKMIILFGVVAVIGVIISSITLGVNIADIQGALNLTNK